MGVDDEGEGVNIFEGKVAEFLFPEGVNEILKELFFSFLNFVDLSVVPAEGVQIVVEGDKVRAVLEIVSGQDGFDSA